MIKRVLLVVVLALAVLTMAKPIRVVHVALGNYGDHWVQLVSGARQMAKALGMDLTVLDSQMSNSKQVQNLENAISMKPDAIFIDHGDGNALKPGIVKAMKKGIPVIIFDVITDAEVTSDISQDDYMLGYKSLLKLALDINGKGNIIIVTLSGIAPLERRMKVVQLILDRFPKLKVAQTLAPEFGSAVITQTTALVDAVLKAKGKEISAIWAPYDQLAIGALQAVNQNGLKIPVYSVDVSPYDLKLMARPGSNWKATAACDPAEIGRVAMRIAYLAATGQKNKIPRYVIIPAALITQEMARKINLSAGEYLTKDIVSEWGDSGVAWTDEMRKMVEGKMGGK